jgi:hypothetical protein
VSIIGLSPRKYFPLKKRAQAGTEYLAIVGIALIILASGMVIFLDYSRSSNSQVVSSQLNIIGNTIMSNAEAMYVLGNESWVTIEFNFPSSVTETAISSDSEMYFSYAGIGGTSQVVFFSDRFKISSGDTLCSGLCYLGFTPGMNKVRIKSNGNFVSIRKMN